MSTGTRLPLAKAQNIAERFLNLINPHIKKAEIAGSVRREVKEVGDIEIVVVEDPSNPLVNLFHNNYPGMIINGPRLKRFKYDNGVQIELYITSENDYGRMLAIRTGSSFYSHSKLAVTWNRRGWAGTEHGLRRKAECIKKSSKWTLKPEFEGRETLPPPFKTEADFFEFLGIPWEAPNYRNWVSDNPAYNYSK